MARVVALAERRSRPPSRTRPPLAPPPPPRPAARGVCSATRGDRHGRRHGAGMSMPPKPRRCHRAATARAAGAAGGVSCGMDAAAARDAMARIFRACPARQRRAACMNPAPSMPGRRARSARRNRQPPRLAEASIRSASTRRRPPACAGCAWGRDCAHRRGRPRVRLPHHINRPLTSRFPIVNQARAQDGGVAGEPARWCPRGA